MQHNLVSYGHVIANQKWRSAWLVWPIVAHMQDRAILYIGSLTDTDEIYVPTDNARGPD